MRFLALYRMAVGVVAAALAFTAATAAAQQAPTGSKAPLWSKLPEAVQKEGVLRLAGDSHPPYRVTSDGKTWSGTDTDFARALEPLLGVRIEQHLVTGLPAMLAGIESGRFHFAMGPIRDTKEREVKFDFVVWTLTRPSFIYPTGARKIEAVEHLCGLKVALVAGTVLDDVVKRVGARCKAAGVAEPTMLTFADHQAIMLSLQSRRADVGALTMTGALAFADASPGKFTVYADLTNSLGIDQLGLFAAKTSKLGPVLFEAMQMLFKSGEYDRILNRYGMGPVRVEAPRMNIEAQ